MALVDGTYALITSPIRSIGGIIPNVVVEEIGTDVLRVSDHPVEVGAAVSDHSFKMPVELIMRVGWSDSSGAYEGYSASIYAALLQLQASREPFSVSTGKRFYSNMLIGLLNQATDEASEHALIATVELREVIITGTQMGSEAAPSNQASPQQTASPTNLGAQALVPQ